MIVGHDLFPELDYKSDRAEIIRRLRQKKFPDTRELPILGFVVGKCWHLEYDSMADILKGVDADNRSFAGHTVA